MEIEKIKAASDAEAAKARQESMIASEDARIGRERQTKAMEVAKQSESRSSNDFELGVEIRRLTAPSSPPPSTWKKQSPGPKAELARAEVVLAEEHVQTERDRAVAETSDVPRVQRVNEQGAVEQGEG